MAMNFDLLNWPYAGWVGWQHVAMNFDLLNWPYAGWVGWQHGHEFRFVELALRWVGGMATWP